MLLIPLHGQCQSRRPVSLLASSSSLGSCAGPASPQAAPPPASRWRCIVARQTRRQNSAAAQSCSQAAASCSAAAGTLPHSSLQAHVATEHAPCPTDSCCHHCYWRGHPTAAELFAPPLLLLAKAEALVRVQAQALVRALERETEPTHQAHCRHPRTGSKRCFAARHARRDPLFPPHQRTACHSAPCPER